MAELEILMTVFGLFAISFGLSRVITYANTNKKKDIQVEPTTDDIISAVDEAKVKMSSSLKLQEIDIFESLTKELVGLRLKLIKQEDSWPKEGSLLLKEITELADAYILGHVQTKSFSDPMKGYKEIKKAENEILALLAKIRTRRAEAIGEITTTSTTDGKFSNIIEQINRDVERGIQAGKDEINSDTLLLRGVKFDYLPQTLAAFNAANGHPDAEERLKSQLEKIQQHAKDAADRLTGDPLMALNMNQRFLDEKFRLER